MVIWHSVTRPHWAVIGNPMPKPNSGTPLFLRLYSLHFYFIGFYVIVCNNIITEIMKTNTYGTVTVLSKIYYVS